MSADSPTAKAGARWLPFQCPSCFGLFRARREEAGELGRCPGCSTRLLIPEPEVMEVSSGTSQGEAEAAPIKEFAKAEIVEQVEEENSHEDWNSQSKRRKRFAGEKEESLDWEDGDAIESKASIPWIFVISMAMLGALLVAGGYKFIESNEGGDTPASNQVAQADFLQSQTEAQQKEMVAGAEEEDDQTRKMIESFERFDLAKIRGAIKGFLSATTVNDRLKYARVSEGIEEKMRSYYAGEAPEDEGFRSIDQTKVVYRGNFASTFVRLEDFLDYPIVVERLGEDDYRIDWESWVGYCEKKVGEMIALKPTKPILVRAVATNEHYYNYSFSDDSKWLSLKLAFRDEDRTLWAYADRDSNVGKALKIYRREVQSRPLILRVKYPKNGRANDQVIIHEVISDGWVTFPTEE
ncbi:MAG: hypothetical protein ACON5H_03780 [Akkermansiaceae bacterium]